MQTEPNLHAELDLAIEELNKGWSAVAAWRGAVLARESGRRLEPALTILRQMRGQDLERESVKCAFADKVMGLAAFRLACLLGAQIVYGELASSLAVEEGKHRGIVVVYHRLVPAIMNMQQDGLCPMEHLAYVSENDYEFYRALRARQAPQARRPEGSG